MRTRCPGANRRGRDMSTASSARRGVRNVLLAGRLKVDYSTRAEMTDQEKMQICMAAALGIAAVTVIATYAWLGV